MELISTVAAAYLVVSAVAPGGDLELLKIPMKSMEACEQHLVADIRSWTQDGRKAPAFNSSYRGGVSYRCFRTDVKK